MSDRRVLVLGPSRHVDELRERGLETEQGTADPASLERCAAVYVAEPVLGDVLAALAAGRLVILEQAVEVFGLQDGIDCFYAATADEGAAIIEAAALDPEAFAPMLALGTLTARRSGTSGRRPT